MEVKKATYMLTAVLALSTAFFMSAARAQNDVGDLFKSSPEDATKLTNAYLSPLFKGLGSGLNSGWTHTAKTKGFLKFEVRVSASGALVPVSDQTYDVNMLGLTSIKPVNNAVTTGPTAFGKDQAGSTMKIVDNNGNTVQTFDLPPGLGFHIVPTPQVQLTLGLPKHIDVSLRLVPSLKISDEGGKVSMFGAGAKIELLPLLMGKTGKLLPVDLAVALAYTQIDFKLPLDISNQTDPNQRIESKFKGFNMDLILSKKLTIFTPFVAVGYQTSSTNLSALGTYSFDTPAGSQNFTDPIVIKQNDLSGLRASAGFQLKLAIFKIYGSYTAAKYNTVNAGIAFGIGN